MIKYSVIIPVYNNRETLSVCLSAIKKQISCQTEIIVVDDRSTQKGIEKIARRFTNHFFQLKKNYGAGKVRNFGAKNASGEWLIFIDSDVVVSANFFKEVVKKSKFAPFNAYLQGVYGWQTPVANICSQYKNLYYYYNYFYRIKKENYSYLSSHCFIIRRKTFESVGGFNRNIKTVIEDADLGFRLFQNGYNVVLENKLIVTHLKKFSLSSLLINDAKLSSAKIKLVLRNIFKKEKKGLIIVSGGRASEMYPVILNVVLSPIILLLLLFSSKNFISRLLILLLLILVLFNYSFIKFIASKKGLIFLLRVIPVFYLDMLSAFGGVIMGIVDYSLLGRKY